MYHLNASGLGHGVYAIRELLIQALWKSSETDRVTIYILEMWKWKIG